ncbi:MAG TPA: hypothetical protein VE990_02675 [Acidimicrobiales bacterium]|nr:hypothetical protein [Acidimicrobiales bacterium]
MTGTTDARTTASTDEIVGPLRRSVNAASGAKGSIHDDDTAQNLGLRGGTVAGSVHLDLFPPLLVDAFGQRWFETGSVSINFRNPTVDREPVRAIIGRPPAGAADAQVAARIEREDGMLVGEGTAAVGRPGQPSALRSLDLSRFAGGELKILAGVSGGEAIAPVEVEVGRHRQQAMIDGGLVTEVLPWYGGDSPWGGPIALPQISVHYLYQVGANHLGRKVAATGGGVGLFGAIELFQKRGPLMLDRTYTMSGTVLAVGQSPRTEYAWFEVEAADEAGPVSGLVMQLRWMKASSPQYR